MQKDSVVTIRLVLRIFFALVWLINGLFCKVLNLVPRHQLIVARILGGEYAGLITKTIGFLEILIFFWILTGIKSRLSAVFQIIVVLTMNVIEFVLVPDLLLFGKANLMIAFAFTGIIAADEFVLAKSLQKPS